MPRGNPPSSWPKRPGYELLCELISRRHTEDRFSLVSHVPKAPRDLAVLSAAPRLLEALAPRVQCWVEVVPGRPAAGPLRSPDP